MNEHQWNRGHGYEAITNLSLTKALKIYNGEKTASATKTAGKTG
jgi:hypothetical protein